MAERSQQKSLAQRLQEKIAADQIAVTQITSDALLKQGSAFENAWKNALDLTEKELLVGTSAMVSKVVAEMKVQLQSAARTANRVKHWTSATEKALRHLILFGLFAIATIAAISLWMAVLIAW